VVNTEIARSFDPLFKAIFPQVTIVQFEEAKLDRGTLLQIVGRYTNSESSVKQPDSTAEKVKLKTYLRCNKFPWSVLRYNRYHRSKSGLVSLVLRRKTNSDMAD
jgi:hypothetical protein